MDRPHSAITFADYTPRHATLLREFEGSGGVIWYEHTPPAYADDYVPLAWLMILMAHGGTEH